MADKKINISLGISADLNDFQKKIEKLQREFDQVKFSDLSSEKISKVFDNIQSRLKKLQELTDKSPSLLGKTDYKQAEKEVGNLQTDISKLVREIQQLDTASKEGKLKILPKGEQERLEKLNEATKKYLKTLSQESKRLEDLEKKQNKLKQAQSALAQLEQTKKSAKSKKEVADSYLKGLNTQLARKQETLAAQKQTEEAVQSIYKAQGLKGKKIGDTEVNINGTVTSLNQIRKEAGKTATEIAAMEQKIQQYISKSDFNQLNQDIQAQRDLIVKLEEEVGKLQTDNPATALKKLKTALEQAGVSMEGIGDLTKKEDIEAWLSNLNTSALEKFRSGLQGVEKATEEVQPELEKMGQSVRDSADDFNAAERAAQDLSTLKYQLMDFFSVTGAIQLFRRAIQSAFETVKELDAAMTEIAVVSDFSVNDMWGQLPRFTEQANELGMAIKDTYAATTLYVQQGLDLDKSMKLATETLKMAAVAGMDAANATDAMTAALRGFNMELDGTSAQRVNDVYSELAAITASDTQEISTAMTKTASIAHSVNMEFETTAAFLAQGIETTREAAETIGTMLKTVIGRFSEVKSLYTEGQLTGQDEEGETIDVNKVQTALRAAGISMNEFLAGNEGLDQVFLRLSKRWNDLDILTQRYIATQAAGSRQQSRFIAIMQDYAKTTELVNAAYNSTGSGQKQFEKTLDSLASKLTKLKNAWDQFTMGFANNEIIGAAVTLLTGLLTAINGIIDGISGGNGLIKSVVTLGAAFAGLKAGGAIIDKILRTGFIQRKIDAFNGNISNSSTSTTTANSIVQTRSFIQNGKTSAKNWIQGWKSAGGVGGKKDFLVSSFSNSLNKVGQSFSVFSSGMEENLQNQVYSGLGDISKGIDKKLLGKDFSELNSLSAQLKLGKISAEDFQNQLVTWGVKEQEAAKITKDYTNQIALQQEKMQSLSQTGTALGMSLTILGGVISSVIPGAEEFGKVLQTVGAALMGISMALPAVEKGITWLSGVLNVAPKTLNIYVAAFAVIVAAVVAIVSLIKKNSPEAQLEKASKATEKAKEMAEGAAQAYDELLSKKSEFDKLTTSLETLTQGTLEWRKALAEANNEVINLQKEFPELKVSVDKATGQLKIDNWGDVLKAQTKRIEATNKQLAMAQVNENNKQLEITKKGIRSDKELTSEEKAKKEEAEKLKTESTNVALISSLISKYQTEANKDILQNLAETILKDMTYEVEVQDTKGSGGNTTSVNTTHKETRTSNVYESKVNADANKAVNSLSASQRKTKAEEVFGKDAVAKMKDEEIKDALKDYEKGVAIENITKKVANLTPDQQELLNRIQGTYTGTKSGWDTAQQKTFSDEDAKVIQDILGLDNTQTVLDMAKSGTDAISANIESIETQFERFGEEYSGSFLDQFSADNLSNIASQVDEMSTKNARAYLNAYSEALDGVKEKDKARLDNYLSSIDLSDAVQVLDAKDFMKNLGMDETQIEKFWATANSAVKPYITSLEQIQSLNERISKLGEVQSLVENGEKTFSSSNKESLVSAGFADTDFLQTGIDEWTYIGKDNNDLLRQINEKVAQIGGHIVENLQNSVKKGEEYKKKIDADEDGSTAEDLKLLAENGYSGTNYDRKKLEELATTLNIVTEGLSEEGIANKLIDAYNMVVNLADNKDAVKKELVNNASRQYDLTGDFGTYTGNLTSKEQRDIMEAQLVKNTGAVELYNKLKAETNDTSKELNVELADEAIQLVKLTDRYKVATKKIEDYRDILIQGESAGTDFFAALDSAKSDLSTLFNVDKELITENFIQQYAQDIYDLAEGGEVGTQAFQNLWEAIKQIKLDSMVEGLDFFIKDSEDIIDDFSNWVEGLDPTIGIGTELSTEGLESGLILLAQQAYNAGKDVQTALAPAIARLEELTGTKIKIQYEEEEFDSGGRYISAKSMEGLLAQGWHVGKGGKLVRTKAIAAVSASKARSSYDEFVAPSGSSSGKSSTGGSSSEKKESTWENPYDKLYNLTEEINEALRRREKLEKEYDRILERRGSTFQELRKNYNAQLQSLQKEITLQNQLRAGRLTQLNTLSSETYKGQDSDGNELIKSFADWGVTKYGSYNPNTGLLKIDWDAIDDVKDENLGSAIEAYISRLEELQGQIEDIDTQIEDFKDKVTELQKEGMQDYLDFEQKVYDAIVNQQQQLIDDYQDLSDKINDSNSKILDSIQRSIDLQRQIRDNTQTEEDINEKEARLAYLRQDTSNGNLLEIKQLEEELADDRQNYEDSLIDQQLERLTQQNDDAQTARERQIDLMQKQLDYASKNGDFWNQTYELLASGFSADGNLNQASQLWNLLQKDEGWKGMSKFGQLNWQEEISKAILAASQGYANWNMYKAEKVDKSLTMKNGLTLTYDGKNWKDSNGNIYNGVDYDSTIGDFTYTGRTDVTPPKNNSENSNNSNKKISVGSRVRANSNSLIYADSYGGGGAHQYYANDPIYTVLDENNGYYLTRYHKLGSGYTGWFRKKDLTAYKTGGIADFTGPAWLDGTKSSPELILNARDTENFIALKDILSSVMNKKGFSNNAQSVGDMYFNIDINVDELSNDYDVEDLSKKIKQELTDSAMYRNVNLVNFIR
jgi:TP901 family phage tail tape measure protein